MLLDRELLCEGEGTGRAGALAGWRGAPGALVSPQLLHAAEHAPAAAARVRPLARVRATVRLLGTDGVEHEAAELALIVIRYWREGRRRQRASQSLLTHVVTSTQVFRHVVLGLTIRAFTKSKVERFVGWLTLMPLKSR